MWSIFLVLLLRLHVAIFFFSYWRMSDTEPSGEEDAAAKSKRKEDLDTLLQRCQRMRNQSSLTEMCIDMGTGTPVYQR